MKLVHAAEALIDVVKEITDTGQILAPEELQKARLRVCNMCHHFNGKTCARCGCFMSVKVKLAGVRCPMDYWNEKIIEEALTGEMTPPVPRSCCGG